MALIPGIKSLDSNILVLSVSLAHLKQQASFIQLLLCNAHDICKELNFSKDAYSSST